MGRKNKTKQNSKLKIWEPHIEWNYEDLELKSHTTLEICFPRITCNISDGSPTCFFSSWNLTLPVPNSFPPIHCKDIFKDSLIWRERGTRSHLEKGGRVWKQSWKKSIPVSQLHCLAFTFGSFQRNKWTKLEEFGISLVVGTKKNEVKRDFKR